jgi:hypothetical protein
MAAKKKSKKKSRAKKVQTRKASAKKSAKKKTSRRKTAAKRTAKRASAASAKPARARRQTRAAASPESWRVPALSGDADSQGLSDVERADSESVTELLDEGNTFEAGVVSGVERADDAEGKEVRTREFAEDDVPEEYLDEQ